MIPCTRGLFIAFLIGLAACAPQSRESHSDDSQLSIVGGREVMDGEWSGVVGLTFRNKLFCTGYASSSVGVVTAAHCIGDVRARLKPGETVEKVIGVYAGLGSPYGAVIPQGKVKKVFVHPRYGLDPIKRHDLAYLELETPIPDVEPLVAVNDPFEAKSLLQPGRNVRVIGFGNKDSSEKPLWGTKASVDVPILDVSSHEFRAGEIGRDSCGGDSGGPALAMRPDGQWRVVGLVSYGPVDCGQPGLNGEVRPGSYANLRDMACWLASVSGSNVMDFNCKALATPSQEPEADDQFLASCRNRNIHPTEAFTVKALLHVAGTQDCEAAHAVLQQKTSLDLSSLYLSNLKPLAGFNNLVEIDLSGNYLQDVSVLPLLPALRKVELKLNMIQSFQDIEGLRKKGVTVNGSSYQFDPASLVLEANGQPPPVTDPAGPVIFKSVTLESKQHEVFSFAHFGLATVGPELTLEQRRSFLKVVKANDRLNILNYAGMEDLKQTFTMSLPPSQQKAYAALAPKFLESLLRCLNSMPESSAALLLDAMAGHRTFEPGDGSKLRVEFETALDARCSSLSQGIQAQDLDELALAGVRALLTGEPAAGLDRDNTKALLQELGDGFFGRTDSIFAEVARDYLNTTIMTSLEALGSADRMARLMDPKGFMTFIDFLSVAKTRSSMPVEVLEAIAGSCVPDGASLFKPFTLQTCGADVFDVRVLALGTTQGVLVSLKSGS